MERHKYTPEELQFLRDNIEGTTLQEQTDLFNERFGTNLTKDKIRAIKCKNKIKPINPAPRRFTGFKKNHIYATVREVGVERYTKCGGIMQVKVAMPNVWRPKHYVLYEKYHNVKLAPDEDVIFLDGDIYNFDKDNLKLTKKSNRNILIRNNKYGELS